MRKTVARLQEFSLPLIFGVVVALVAANVDAEWYHAIVHTPFHLWGAEASAGHGEHAEAAHSGWEHYFTMHFLVNDLFMVLFFGIAAKEITEACLPKGALNPVSKAINPLIATMGGVVGPVACFLLLNSLFGTTPWRAGWGIPTATDIALAWLVARFLFGRQHPAVSFLLLLAVADDAIGLGIIAIGYPDPNHPTQWMNVLWLIPGMLTAYGLRRAHVQSWIPYIAIGGAFSWWGLFSAHLHPALALVFIVPFLPGPKSDLGLFEDPDESCGIDPEHHSTLECFEHDMKIWVDFGLFFFAFANAGVAFSEINGLTWIVLSALIFGKIIGITSFSLVAMKCGFPLPQGMTIKHVLLTSIVAGLGLTVALFVSGQAFADPVLQGSAKMGAVFSVVAAVLAFAAREALGLRLTSTKSTAVHDALMAVEHMLEEACEVAGPGAGVVFFS